MVQRIGRRFLIVFAIATLILALFAAGRIAMDYVTLDVYFRPLPRSIQIISIIALLCALLCVGLFLLWRIKKRDH